VKLYGFDKAGIGNMRKAYQHFWLKLLGRSWTSIACIVLGAEQIRFEFLAGEQVFPGLPNIHTAL